MELSRPIHTTPKRVVLGHERHPGQGRCAVHDLAPGQALLRADVVVQIRAAGVDHELGEASALPGSPLVPTSGAQSPIACSTRTTPAASESHEADPVRVEEI
jgi:hypothetical protein